MFQKLFFNLFYLRKPPWDTGVSPPELIEFIEKYPPGRALDMGCGTGTNVITLAKKGWQATGVDFAHRAIKNARVKAAQQGVQVDFYVDDVIQLENISGKFDLILDMGCFHSLNGESRQAYIKNIKNLLSTNGIFMLYAFFREKQNFTGSGVTEGEIEALSSCLELENRVNGFGRGRRRSAWFYYRLPNLQNDDLKICET
jgi:SAM-dependent methyltransferase